jgi:hypothetical protein
MDKMSKKVSKPSMDEDYTKFFAIFAGLSALGIGIFALKEIKNTKNEIIKLKGADTAKMDNLEQQMKSISDFIKNGKTIPQPIQRPTRQGSKIKKVPIPEPEKIVIINEPYNPDEYEEVEVTDSESED